MSKALSLKNVRETLANTRQSLASLRDLPPSRLAYRQRLRDILAPIHVLVAEFPNRDWMGTGINFHRRLSEIGNQILSAHDGLVGEEPLGRRRTRAAIQRTRSLCRAFEEEIGGVKRYEPVDKMSVEDEAYHATYVPETALSAGLTAAQLAPQTSVGAVLSEDEVLLPHPLAGISPYERKTYVESLPDLKVEESRARIPRTIKAKGYSLRRVSVLAFLSGINEACFNPTLMAEAGVEISGYLNGSWLIEDQLILFHPTLRGSERQIRQQRALILERALRRLKRREFEYVDILDGISSFSRSAGMEYLWLFPKAAWNKINRNRGTRTNSVEVEKVLLVPDTNPVTKQIQVPLKELRAQLDSEHARATAELSLQREALAEQLAQMGEMHGEYAGHDVHETTLTNTVLGRLEADLKAKLRSIGELRMTLRLHSAQLLYEPRPDTEPHLRAEIARLAGPDFVPVDKLVNPTGGVLGKAIAEAQTIEKTVEEMRQRLLDAREVRAKIKELDEEINGKWDALAADYRKRFLKH